MGRARQNLGDRGELLAEHFLSERGYCILARKYRCREGEIDLVCRDGDMLAFVEVKTRRGTAFGVPEEAVTATKLAHLESACRHYLAAQEDPEQPWRIDVVAVQLDGQGRMVEMRLTPGVGAW